MIQEDVEQYDEYWHELTSIEGVRLNQNFLTSQLEPTRRQMRIDALHAAKQKAEDLAAVVGGQALELARAPVIAVAVAEAIALNRPINHVSLPQGHRADRHLAARHRMLNGELRS